MTAHPTSRTQRALDKASVMGGSARVRWMSGGWRRVKGTRVSYFVNVRDWFCTCPAGQRGLPCYHAAACFMAQLRDQAGGQKIERGN